MTADKAARRSRRSASTGRRDPVRQRVAEGLRAALVAGELEPGQIYSAPALADRFETSATPVREAMLALARDGMVEVVPNTGFRVTAVTPQELDQLAEVRLLLEVPTMGTIAENHSDADAEVIMGLRKVADAMVTAERTKDIVAYLTADTHFHTTFLGLHGNPELVQIVRRARDRSRLQGLLPLANSGQLEATTREHHKLVDLVLARDRQATEDLTRAHIHHVRQEWSEP